MKQETIIALLIGTVAMCLLTLIMMRSYRVALWKSVPVAIVLTITGTLGTYIWYFVEASGFGGRSYYGAVFLVPFAFLAFAKLMRIPYRALMDFCAPSECVMLTIMKYMCMRDGCCSGRVLKYFPDGSVIVFPSQIVEAVVAVCCVVILMLLARKEKNRGKIYGWYLLIYGALRFVLNFLRAGTTPFLAGLPIGNVWSLVAIFAGVLWITDRKLMIAKRNNESQTPETEFPDLQ